MAHHEEPPLADNSAAAAAGARVPMPRYTILFFGMQMIPLAVLLGVTATQSVISTHIFFPLLPLPFLRFANGGFFAQCQ